MPIRVEPPKSVPKVFSLATPQHMLAKLYWEIEQLKKASAEEGRKLTFHQEQAYCAFNCAITAWHLTDWVWGDASEALRIEMCKYLDATTCCKRDFQNAICRKYRALHICRQIANGSKHMKLEREDPVVEVGAIWEEHMPRAGSARAGEKISGFLRKFVVVDNEIRKPAVEVFDEAGENWKDFLGTWGFIEGSLVSP